LFELIENDLFELIENDLFELIENDLFELIENDLFELIENDLFELIENDITLFSENGSVIIMEDMNARTGNESDFIENEFHNQNIPLFENYLPDSDIIDRFSRDHTILPRGRVLNDICM
jgi:hypothetical protein